MWVHSNGIGSLASLFLPPTDKKFIGQILYLVFLIFLMVITKKELTFQNHFYISRLMWDMSWEEKLHCFLYI